MSVSFNVSLTTTSGLIRDRIFTHSTVTQEGEEKSGTGRIDASHGPFGISLPGRLMISFLHMSSRNVIEMGALIPS